MTVSLAWIILENHCRILLILATRSGRRALNMAESWLVIVLLLARLALQLVVSWKALRVKSLIQIRPGDLVLLSLAYIKSHSCSHVFLWWLWSVRVSSHICAGVSEGVWQSRLGLTHFSLNIVAWAPVGLILIIGLIHLHLKLGFGLLIYVALMNLAGPILSHSLVLLVILIINRIIILYIGRCTIITRLQLLRTTLAIWLNARDWLIRSPSWVARSASLVWLTHIGWPLQLLSALVIFGSGLGIIQITLRHHLILWFRFA